MSCVSFLSGNKEHSDGPNINDGGKFFRQNVHIKQANIDTPFAIAMRAIFTFTKSTSKASSTFTVHILHLVTHSHIVLSKEIHTAHHHGHMHNSNHLNIPNIFTGKRTLTIPKKNLFRFFTDFVSLAIWSKLVMKNGNFWVFKSKIHLISIQILQYFECNVFFKTILIHTYKISIVFYLVNLKCSLWIWMN